MGEIGDGDSVEVLREIYQLPGPEDMRQQRRQLVLLSLGLLAQQGSKRAEVVLTGLLEDKDDMVRAEALSELAVAYWHRPNKIPAPLLLRMFRLADEPRREIREAALAALSTLADLGCEQAADFFKGESAP